RSEDWYDRDTWLELAKANVLGIAIPEAYGGLGLGLLDLCFVLREIGRAVAPLPAVPTLVSGAVTIPPFRSDEQQAVLSGVASGDVILTAALSEYETTPNAPQTTATRDGDGWRIDGVKTAVPAMHVAETVLVPCRTDSGTVVLLVPAGAAGISAVR